MAFVKAEKLCYDQNIKNILKNTLYYTSQLIQEGKSINEIATTFNVHSATVYRMLDLEESLRVA